MATPPPTYRNYAERYADQARDPWDGRYGEVMKGFRARVGVPDAPDFDTRLEVTVFATSEVQPHAYLAVSNAFSDGSPAIYLYHRPSALTPPMGSSWNKQEYVFVGDVQCRQPPVVAPWPRDAFRRLQPRLIASSALLDASFASDAQIQQAGPFEMDVPGQTHIATRRLMYLPPRYVPMVMAHQPLTPRRLWQLVGHAIRTDPLAEHLITELNPLLEWMRAACTKDLDGEECVLDMGTPGVVLPIPTGYHEHIEKVLDQDVPHWRGVVPDVGPAQVAAAVNTLTDQLRNNNNEQARRTHEAGDKSPAKYWGEATGLINRITWTHQVEEIPELYRVIARSNKSNLRTLISEHLRMVAQEMGLDGLAPLVTPTLARKLASLQFHHRDLDNLDEGIHPFTVGTRNKVEQSALSQAILQYDQVMEGGAAAQLRDLQVLSEKDKASLPRTILQARTTLQNFQVLLQAMLTVDHPLVVNYGRFMRRLGQNLANLEDLCTPNMPAQVVRYVQIRVSNWFTTQEESTALVLAPEFTELLDKIQNRDTTWVPTLPGTTPTLPARSNANPPARSPATETDPRTDVGRGTRVNNTTYDDAFSQYKSQGIPLKQAREKATAAGKPVPQGVNGEMCLCYHILGFCWTNCNRNAGHKKLPATDKTSLLEWCRAAYA
jgi:hypothetical protein